MAILAGDRWRQQIGNSLHVLLATFAVEVSEEAGMLAKCMSTSSGELWAGKRGG